ncbi:MAG: hypothetical protein QOG53_2628 [Frankiales bacterium]|jgi:hypothetical protein|nr:hypothetical protein [Frankiales bacterium]
MTEDDGRTGVVASELKEVEETLARLRAEESNRSRDVGDSGDAAALLTEYEEQDAVIASLEARRERLLAQLGPE